MSTMSHSHDHATGAGGHSLSLFQPFVWLGKGWEDMWRSQRTSLGYGLLVSAMGMLLIMMARHPYFLAAVFTGFMLVGPLLTTGLCELSRRQARGERADFETSLEGLVRNRSGLMSFALTLLILSGLWFVMSTFMLVQILGSVAPDLGMSTWAAWSELLEILTADQIRSYLVVGGSLAAVVFALSLVTIPMLIDRDVTASFAMRYSFRQSLRHLPTMLVWAALIAVLVVIGFATFLLGMIVVFPLLGHATWHAYEDMQP